MTGSRREVPNDPGRRARILDAALDVIAEHGVHRTTHRRIAAQAEVPLGSLTYYFTTLDVLLAEAFTQLSDLMSVRYREALSQATTTEQARAAVVDLICGPGYATDREMTLVFEMYAYANHSPAVAATTRTWMLRSRDSLALHFPPSVCEALDVLIEGFPMHRAFGGAPLDRTLVAATVDAIVTHVVTTEDVG